MEDDLVPAAGPPAASMTPRRSQSGLDDYWRGVCEERTRISCELHDGLFPHLNAAALRLQNITEDLLARTVPDPFLSATLRDEMIALQALLTLASAEMRAWLRDQPTPAAVLESLEESIRRIAADLETSLDGTCRIRLTVGEGIPLLCPRTRWELVCIGQEALRNATRHGAARAVEIRLEHLPTERQVRMRVRDDGCGFDPCARGAEDQVHFGLRAMRLRAERLGGTFIVESVPDAGTTITSSVPTTVHRATSPRPFFGSEHYRASLDH